MTFYNNCLFPGYMPASIPTNAKAFIYYQKGNTVQTLFIMSLKGAKVNLILGNKAFVRTIKYLKNIGFYILFDHHKLFIDDFTKIGN